MNAEPLLAKIARAFAEHRLDAVMVGNSAAALHGALVTTLDIDFMFRKTPRNMQKIKAFANALGGTILRPYYPAADLYRVVRDDGLQVDFMVTIHGIRSFEALRDRAQTFALEDTSIHVASLVARESERALADMIRRWQALPPHRRTNFLRKRIGRRGSTL